MKKTAIFTSFILTGCLVNLPVYANEIELNPNWSQAFFIGTHVGAGNYTSDYSSNYSASFTGLKPELTFNDGATNIGSVIPQFEAGYLWKLGASEQNALGALVQFTIPSGQAKTTDNIDSSATPSSESYDLTTTSQVNFTANFLARYAYFVTSAVDVYTNIGFSLANAKINTDITDTGTVAGNTAAPSVSQTENIPGVVMAVGTEIFLDNAHKTALTVEGDYGIYATENLSDINQVANTGTSTVTNRQLQLSDYALEIGLSRYF